MKNKVRAKTKSKKSAKAPTKTRKPAAAKPKRSGRSVASKSAQKKIGSATTVKIRKIGGSHGIVLPKEILTQLKVGEGQELFLVQTPNGFEATPYDPDFANAIEDARDYMRRHRDAFRELAKG